MNREQAKFLVKIAALVTAGLAIGNLAAGHLMMVFTIPIAIVTGCAYFWLASRPEKRVVRPDYATHVE